jgi:hypothetical protein
MFEFEFPTGTDTWAFASSIVGLAQVQLTSSHRIIRDFSARIWTRRRKPLADIAGSARCAESVIAVRMRPAGGAPRGLDAQHSGEAAWHFARSRFFAGHRRVVVKARVVRHTGRASRSALLAAHIAYIDRDGVTREPWTTA